MDFYCPSIETFSPAVMDSKKLEELKDYYLLPDGRMVFTEAYHLKRGYCCGSNCLHCPYDGIEEDTESKADTYQAIQCPTCHETFRIHVYPEEGTDQSLIYDCEICCRPIQLDIHFEKDVPTITCRI